MSSEKTESCKGCGATVYPEHLETGIAKRRDGKLFCSHCLKEEEAAASGVLDVLEPIPLDDDDIGGTRVEMSDSVVALRFKSGHPDYGCKGLAWADESESEDSGMLARKNSTIVGIAHRRSAHEFSPELTRASSPESSRINPQPAASSERISSSRP